MAVVVLVQAAVIAVLAVLACGLLRSHGEVLRALDGLGGRRARPAAGHTSPVRLRLPERRGSAATAATDLVGASPSGDKVRVDVVGAGHSTVLAFLSSTCHTCSGFWRTLQRSSASELPDGTQVVVVTKGPDQENQASIRDLASGEVPVIMSTEAWVDYAVPATPYFVHVDGPTGKVIGQGSGRTWEQVTSLLSQATADDGAARRRGGRPTLAEQEADVDRKLMAAGIHPGDPSLYPSGPPEAGES